MLNQRAAPPLTVPRITRILELDPQLRQRTKKEAKMFLAVPRLPDLNSDETLVDVIAPQMSRYFADWNEDPAQYFSDRSRMLMIFLAIKAGGVPILIEKYGQVAGGELLGSGVSKLQEKGIGNPAAAEALLSQATKHAEHQVRRLQSVRPEEEAAVKICMKEIEKCLSRRGRKKKVSGVRSGVRA